MIMFIFQKLGSKFKVSLFSCFSDRRLVPVDGVDRVQFGPDGAEVRPRQPGAAALLRQPGAPVGRGLLPGGARPEEQVRDRLQR